MYTHPKPVCEPMVGLQRFRLFCRQSLFITRMGKKKIRRSGNAREARQPKGEKLENLRNCYIQIYIKTPLNQSSSKWLFDGHRSPSFTRVCITSFLAIANIIKRLQHRALNNCGAVASQNRPVDGMPGMNEAKCANHQPQPHCSSDERERERGRQTYKNTWEKKKN